MDFSEWSTGKKVAAIVGLCCVGLIIITMIGGMASPDKTTTTTSSNNSNSSGNGTNGTGEDTTGWQVKIITDTSWSGSVGGEGSSSSYQGKGNKTIKLGNDVKVVSASIQKEGQNSKELKVQILKDGVVKEESSTNAEFGVATASASDF